MDEIIGLISEGIKVAANWKAMGAIIALATLVKLLVDFTKTKLGQKLLIKASAKSKWVRPLVAGVLGFAAGALGALALHKPWIQVLTTGIAGVLASFGASGAHEFIAASTSAGRERRAASASIENALSSGDAQVKTQVESLKAELDKAAAMPTKKARLTALAAWANANPPG